MQPVSQSVSSQSINGATSKWVVLLLPVVGEGGRMAQARVTYLEARGGESCAIAVGCRGCSCRGGRTRRSLTAPLGGA
jgi:hypothetical protein